MAVDQLTPLIGTRCVLNPAGSLIRTVAHPNTASRPLNVDRRGDAGLVVCQCDFVIARPDPQPVHRRPPRTICLDVIDRIRLGRNLAQLSTGPGVRHPRPLLLSINNQRFVRQQHDVALGSLRLDRHPLPFSGVAEAVEFGDHNVPVQDVGGRLGADGADGHAGHIQLQEHPLVTAHGAGLVACCG
jgi:hypothetical protein